MNDDILNELIDAKERIKTSIEDRGVVVDVGLDKYGDKIREISKLPKQKYAWKWDGATTFFYSVWVPAISFINVSRIGFNGPFMYCEADSIEIYDTSHLTQMDFLFSGCSNLMSINRFNVSGLDKYGLFGAFGGCGMLEDVGGFVGLKSNIDMSSSPNLTKKSLRNIINNMAQVSSETIFRVGDNISKLSDKEIIIATNKGWTITT